MLVAPVVLERDDAGRVVRELVGDATPLYRAEDVIRFVEAIELELERANANGNGSIPDPVAVDTAGDPSA
jgi:hypothetical protein